MMGCRRKCCYYPRRRCQNYLIYLFLIMLSLSISFYVYMVGLLEKKGKPDVLFLSSFTDSTNAQYGINDEISDIKKSIGDIEYQGADDENPSEESFLGLLSNHCIVLNDKQKESKFLFTLPPHFHDTNNIMQNKKPTRKKKRPDGTKFISKTVFKATHKKTDKYLYVLGHYEQLGKTLVNLMHAGFLAAFMNRKIVMPFVRNSRLCGLPGGWIGSYRKKSREFLVMDNYFNMKSVEKQFHQNGFADMCHFSEFQRSCTDRKDTVMLYFLYSGSKAEAKRYFRLTDKEYHKLESQLENNTGWTDCSLIEQRVQTAKRMKGIKFSRAICINAEIIKSTDILNTLIGNSTCVTIFLWRGIGPQRTHFNLTLPFSYDTYLSQLSFSDIVMLQAKEFKQKYFSSEPYIGIQIRSERQLGWYGLKKFKHCLDLVVKVASIFVYKKRIRHVFVSADLEKHGSDQLVQMLNSSTLQEAKDYFRTSFENLPVKFYKPDKSRGLIYNDAGFVALTQMEILSKSSHLITLGAGTFQSWATARFKNKKKELKGNQPWSVTRVCSIEVKSAGKLKVPMMNNTSFMKRKQQKG